MRTRNNMRTRDNKGNATGKPGFLTGDLAADTGNQAGASVRSGILVIKKCLTELQAFLQRTRTRLFAIANGTVESCGDLVEDPDLSRVLRDADSSQPLKTLPIHAPAVQRRGRALAAETGRMTEKESCVANLPADSPSGQFVPFGASSDSLKRVDSIDGTMLPGKKTTDPKYPMYEDSGQDWKVSNAFDRNSYYGPTDFGHMPDELECSIPSNWCSDVVNDRIDAICNGIPPIKFGTRQVQSGRVHKSSKLHLANQIRQN